MATSPQTVYSGGMTDGASGEVRPSIQTEGSAVERFLGIAELAVLVVSHLAFEHIDLIALAQVSKRFRAVVLPLLVERVNVRLSRANQLGTYFEQNVNLVNHVQFLRIWDDIAHDLEYGLNPPHLDNIEYSADTWTSLGKLLGAFDNRTPRPPLLELSFGQFQLPRLQQQLEEHPRVLERFASLQIVQDAGTTRKLAGSAGAEEIISNHGFSLANNLENLLRIICNAQDRADSVTFHKLSLAAILLPVQEDILILPPMRPRPWNRIAERISDLSITMGIMNDSDIPALASLIGTRFPKLRRIRLFSNKVCQQWSRILILTSSLRIFLDAHPDLEDVDIELLQSVPGSISGVLAHVTMSRLRSCFLEVAHLRPDAQIDFAERHQHIHSISTSHVASRLASANHPAVTKSLRRLRADASVMLSLLEAGVPLRHVVLLRSNTTDPFKGIQAPSVTCCEYVYPPHLRIHSAEGEWVNQWLSAMPNLVEFTVTFGLDEEWTEVAGTSTVAAQIRLLSDLLANLATQSTKIRALCVYNRAACELPPDAQLSDAIATFPPRLQYLTWHIPSAGKVVFYRVLRPGPSSASSTPDPAPVKPRLQRLPATFRPFVERKTGAWEDPKDTSTFLTLFDHIGDEPRLKHA
ncbi:hypothetical protein OC835_001698 [Tilletia horrida]|nr:hypothetical protein OC835_001698 [Tilletia horrida]